MNQIERDVKSKGKVLRRIKINVFSSLAEAVKASSEADVLGIINQDIADRACNQVRAALTRDISPTAQLTRLAKADPKVAAEIQALLKKYQA